MPVHRNAWQEGSHAPSSRSLAESRRRPLNLWAASNRAAKWRSTTGRSARGPVRARFVVCRAASTRPAGSLAAGSLAAGSLAAGSLAEGSLAAGSLTDGSLAEGSCCMLQRCQSRATNQFADETFRTTRSGHWRIRQFTLEYTSQTWKSPLYI